MVDWANLNKNLSYVNDGLQFGLDLMRPKKAGESLGEKVSAAGINLFGNAAATQNAAELRDWTGSNLGYLAKNSANGDGGQALLNTMNASLFTHQNRMLFGAMFGPPIGFYGGNIWNSSAMMPGGTFGPSFGAPSWPGGDVFRSSFFRNGWFG